MSRWSPKVASGLRGILGLFGASSPAMVMGINEENEVLTDEEKETLEETEAALAWIKAQLAKRKPKAVLTEADIAYIETGFDEYMAFQAETEAAVTGLSEAQLELYDAIETLDGTREANEWAREQPRSK